MPPQKLIFMVGAYGYDWNDNGSPGDVMTFQETMEEARDHHVPTHFDPVSLNPYIAWTDPDSTDHVVWYLDGVTAYNQLRVGRDMGVAGVAIWRLGQEDASLWGVLGRHGLTAGPTAFAACPLATTWSSSTTWCASRDPASASSVRTASVRAARSLTAGVTFSVFASGRRAACAPSSTDASGTVVHDSIVRVPHAVCRRSVWAERTRGRAHVR